MNNLAKKFETPKEVVDLFTEEYKSIDLLKMFLLTSANDVSKALEMLRQWEKNATGSDLVAMRKATATLKQIILKRIELTAIMYGVADSTVPADTTADTTQEQSEQGEPTKILPVPMANIIDRAKKYLQEAKTQIENTQDITDEIAGKLQSEAFASAFHLMKETLGAANYLAADGKKSKKVWTSEEISDMLDQIAQEYFKVDNSNLDKVEETTETTEFTYNDIAAIIKSCFEKNMTIEATIEEVKTFCYGSKIKDNNTIIDNDEKFNSVVNYATNYWNSLNTKETTEVSEDELLTKMAEILDEDLKKLDADERENSVISLVKRTREFFLNNGINLSLKDVKNKIVGLIQEKAPNLWARYQKKMGHREVETPNVDIYDSSHNYKETNPSLYEEASKIVTMEVMFNKAKQLTEEGNWKDALAMVIHLSGSKQVMVSENNPLNLDESQAKTWFKNNILGTKSTEELDKKSREILAAKMESQKVETEAQAVETNQVKEDTGSAEDTQKIESQEKPIGPVPFAGFSKDAIFYPQFATEIPEDQLHAYVLTMSDAPKKDYTFMVADSEVSVDFPCYKDFDAKMDEILEILVLNSNDYKKAKIELTSFLNVYDVKSGVIKDLLQYFQKMSVAERKARKAIKQQEEASADTTVEETVEQTETSTQETVQTDSGSEVTTEETTETESAEVATTTETEEVPAETAEEVTTEQENTESPGGENQENVSVPETTETSPLSDSQTEVAVEEKSESQESSTTQETVVTQTTSGKDISSRLNEIPFETIQPILNARDKGDLNRAIGKFYLAYPEKDKAHDVLFEIFIRYRSDKKYKNRMITRYKSATKDVIVNLISLAIENSSK